VTRVRSEAAGDLSAIREVNLASFPSDAESRLVDMLRAGGHLSVSLVAEVDGRVVGHVAFSPVTTAAGDIGAGLAPVAVMPGSRCVGIGSELIERGLAACASLGLGWAVVLGAPAFYSRFGFRPASEFGLTSEYSDGPQFQAIDLIEGSLPADAGLVRYAPEFAMLV
jgi:putative acetyltransferase